MDGRKNGGGRREGSYSRRCRGGAGHTRGEPLKDIKPGDVVALVEYANHSPKKDGSAYSFKTVKSVDTEDCFFVAGTSAYSFSGRQFRGIRSFVRMATPEESKAHLEKERVEILQWEKDRAAEEAKERLERAGPALLEAAKGVVKIVEETLGGAPYAADLILSELRAAIAQAEGKAP